VQANLSGRWAATYQVAAGAWADQDYEQANFYTYAHPSSHFTWSLTVGRTTPTARYALKNNRLTHRDADGALVEQRDLSADELEATLRDVIGLPVQPVAAADRADPAGEPRPRAFSDPRGSAQCSRHFLTTNRCPLRRKML
jgi:arylamine N-acetyltransferase